MAGRRKRFGAIRKLPSGRFQASYVHPDTKERVPAPSTFKAKADASAWLARVESDIIQGILGKPTKDTKITLGEYAEQWLRSRPTPPALNTLATYRSNLRNHILPAFGDMSLKEIKADKVRQWWGELGNKTGPSARAMAYTLLKAMLTTASEDELIDANPCKLKGVKVSKPASKDDMVVLSPEQVAALADAIHPPYRAMVLLGMYAQLRAGELAGLRRGDFDMEAGTITVNSQLQWIDGENGEKGRWERVDPKSDAGKRTLPVPRDVMREVAKHLLQYVDGDPEALLFRTRRRNPVSESAYNEALRKAAVKINLVLKTKNGQTATITSHDLRHSGLTLYGRTGATLAEIMRQGGHSSARTAMIYQHATSERATELADQMNTMVVLSKKKAISARSA